MVNIPHYRAWTAKNVEARLLEAAETLMLCPHVDGPKAFGSSMPEPLRLPIDAYASSTRRFRRKPDAAAIDRMEETWVWINELPELESRRLVYDWSRTKCDHRGSLKVFAEQNEYSDRALRRTIVRLCGDIASRLNASHNPNLSEMTTMEDMPASDNKCNVAYQHHWRAANARPPIDRDLKKCRFV